MFGDKTMGLSEPCVHQVSGKLNLFMIGSTNLHFKNSEGELQRKATHMESLSVRQDANPEVRP